MLAVAHFHGLPNIEQLWIAFGTGNDFRFVPIDEIASVLCPHMAKGVLFFHAFTGCEHLQATRSRMAYTCSTHNATPHGIYW